MVTVFEGPLKERETLLSISNWLVSPVISIILYPEV